MPGERGEELPVCEYGIENNCPHFVSLGRLITGYFRGDEELLARLDSSSILSQIRKLLEPLGQHVPYAIPPTAGGFCLHPQVPLEREAFSIPGRSVEAAVGEDLLLEKNQRIILPDGREKRVIVQGRFGEILEEKLVVWKGFESLELPDVGCYDDSQSGFDPPIRLSRF